ncbi:MAG: phosphatase PAP2 family protein [Oscillospiraceae bacterium]|nr:phosphatase PAP2 family protein [Oscillospiraceae bacterium]
MKNGIIAKIKRIPVWGWIIGFVYFGLQYGMYRLAELISRLTGTVEYAFVPKIPFIDDRIPIIAVFAVIYLFSYVFWICGPIAASLTKRENFINYIIGLSAAYIIGFLIFIFAPTYMDRAAEGLMDAAAKPGVFNGLLNMIYSNDGSALAFNLFPSYHCLISLYCYLGVRKQPEISVGFRAYSLIMTVLICLSTVFTKQHYAIDIVGGLAISIVCYIVTERLDPGGKIVARRRDKEPA